MEGDPAQLTPAVPAKPRPDKQGRVILVLPREIGSHIIAEAERRNVSKNAVASELVRRAIQAEKMGLQEAVMINQTPKEAEPKPPVPESPQISFPSVAEYVAHCNDCPDHGREWADYVKGLQEEITNALPLDKVKELAKRHKLYPPPSIQIPQ